MPRHCQDATPPKVSATIPHSLMKILVIVFCFLFRRAPGEPIATKTRYQQHEHCCI